MNEVLEQIQRRKSDRVPFDEARKVSDKDLGQILEAARWAPTAHNMQNFEIVVVDDRDLLETLSNVHTTMSQAFVDENYALLSFSEDELKQKKVGLIGAMFPPAWRTPGKKPVLDEAHAHSILGAPIKMTSALLVVLYDAMKRAPASENDALGMMSLGCVMENMWLVAESLGIGFHIQSALGGEDVDREVRRMLAVPDPWRIAFAVRLGYPVRPPEYLRVRREVEDFTHRNRFGRR